ncbi:MAG: HAD-IIIA family hydrolase [Candidatus Cloacimonadales bacterium]|nr:HAD-IIIA family hydrolase [Candidatus Cloacimonadales bacterium]
MEKKRYNLIIFDADDTLRYCTVQGQPCPNKPGEWELLDNVQAKLSTFDWGFPQEGKVGYGIASNQGGVGMGYFSKEIAFQLLKDTFKSAFGFEPQNEIIQMCTPKPHVDSNCRKPKHGMLQKIMAFWKVEAEKTLFVGDMESDKETAKNAGCDFMWAKKFFNN